MLSGYNLCIYVRSEKEFYKKNPYCSKKEEMKIVHNVYIMKNFLTLQNIKKILVCE